MRALADRFTMKTDTGYKSLFPAKFCIVRLWVYQQCKHKPFNRIDSDIQIPGVRNNRNITYNEIRQRDN